MEGAFLDMISKGYVPAWLAVPLILLLALLAKAKDYLPWVSLTAKERADRSEVRRQRMEGRVSELLDEYLSNYAKSQRENGELTSALKSVRVLLEQSLEREAQCEARCATLEARVTQLERKSKGNAAA